MMCLEMMYLMVRGFRESWIALPLTFKLKKTTRNYLWQKKYCYDNRVGPSKISCSHKIIFRFEKSVSKTSFFFSWVKSTRVTRKITACEYLQNFCAAELCNTEGKSLFLQNVVIVFFRYKRPVMNRRVL